MPRLLALIGSAVLLFGAAPSMACIPSVTFDFGSARLDDYGRIEVASYVRHLDANPRARLVLTAFTDAAGRNRRLMLRRAQVVRAAFIREGVRPARIQIELEPDEGWPRTILFGLIAASTGGGC